MNIHVQLKHDRERLHYRRQFVLGPRPLEHLPSWKRIKIRDNLHLTIHPDLNSLQVISGDKSLTLLGYILDPLNHKSGDFEILLELLPQLCSGLSDESLLSTSRFGGRWILIVDDGYRVKAFSDPLGQRQICYTEGKDPGELWCASQPEIISQFLRLSLDQAAQKFVEDQLRADQKEYWWPYNTSLYRGIKQLLPNHYLDLQTATSRRFWPRDRMGGIPFRRALKHGGDILRGLMMSAANRFSLQLLMTSGWDSRVVLAATKELRDEISYFTFLKDDLTEQSADVSVPAHLLPRLGRIHEIVNVPKSVNSEFREIYCANVTSAHEVWIPIAQALFGIIQESGLRVSGSGSETVRQYFRRSASEDVTPVMLAELSGTSGQDFAIQAFGRWLAGVPAIPGVEILDLFYWEQRCGSWLAAGQTEWDIVSDSFTPFNCRALLTTLLATRKEYRTFPDYELYRTLIKKLWSKALCVPINPHKRVYRRNSSIKSRAKRLLVRTHVLDYVPESAIVVAKNLLT